MAFSMEFRQAVLLAYETCGSSIEVAEMFPCSESWVRRLIQVYRETGSLEPKPNKLPDNNKLDEVAMKQLADLIAAKPDMELRELAAALTTKVSVPTVFRARKRLGLTRKKSRSTPPSRIDRM